MSALVSTIRRLIMSGSPHRNLALKAALEELDLSVGRTEDPNAFLNLQKIIFNKDRNSEAQLIDALEGLPLVEGEHEGSDGVPQIRNALLLSGSRPHLIAALDQLLSLDTGAQFVTVFIHHKSY